MVKSGVLAAVMAEFEIDRREYGDVVPTPTLPLSATENTAVAVFVLTGV
jgi:hypothetical protein